MSTNKGVPPKGSNKPPVAAQGKPTVQGKAPVTSGSRPAPRGTSSTSPRTGATARPGAPNTARPRGGAQVYRSNKPKSRGRQFGPLDVALLFGGLVVVGLVIWFGLNLGNNNTSTPAAPANNTNQQAGTSSGPTPTLIPSAVYHNITPVPRGAPAPDFSLPATDGKTYTLSQFVGKPVLLELMAPWCPHCQDDTKILNPVWDKYKDRVQFLAVSAHPYGLGWEEGQQNPISMKDMTWFRDKFNVQYPLLLDTAVKASSDYGVQYFPTIYIIGKDGTVSTEILAEQGNPISVERLSAALDAALQ